VRGTTSLKIVQMMREAGADRSAYAHRVAAGTRHSCFYGRRHAGSAASCWRRSMMVGGMQDFIHADSLAFVSIDGLLQGAGRGQARRHPSAILRRLFQPVIIPTRLTDHDEAG